MSGAGIARGRGHINRAFGVIAGDTGQRWRFHVRAGEQGGRVALEAVHPADQALQVGQAGGALAAGGFQEFGGGAVQRRQVFDAALFGEASAELFPDCFDLVAGSVAALNLPAPYSGWNGNYEVASIEPAAGLNDDQSITIRLPAVLTETSPAIHAWDHVTEEQDMLPGNFSGQLDQIQPPSTISIVTGSLAAQISGDTTVPAVLAYWPASASASTSGYEWEWGYSKRVSDGSGGATWRWEGWRSGGTLADSAADDGGLFLASVPWVQIGTNYRYRVRVRAQGAYGASSWLATNWITATGPAETIPAPQSISASPDGAGRIGVTVQQPADGNVRELLIYGSDSDSALSASLLWTVDAGASTTVTKREAGLGGGVTRYYFARSRDQWGNISVFTDSAFATTV